MVILSRTATLSAVTVGLTLFAAGTALGDSRSCAAVRHGAGSPGSACESAESGSNSGHSPVTTDASAVVLASLEPTFRRLQGAIGLMADLDAPGQGQHTDTPGYTRRPSGAVRMARPAAAPTDIDAASEAATRESSAAMEQSLAASNQQMQHSLQQAMQEVARSMEEGNRAIEASMRANGSAASAASSE